MLTPPQPLRILYVNDHDLVNSRFNGYAGFDLLKTSGHKPSMLVWNKSCDDEQVFTISKNIWIKIITKLGNLIDQLLSLQSFALFASYLIPRHIAFRKADVVHLQLLHSQPSFFSLLSLPAITKKKPTVWTLHDPWPLTGHCVHPETCERWKIGCGKCPDLKKIHPINKDTTALLFLYKKWVYKKSSMDIIVASKWMKNLVDQSPMFKSHKVHVVPFGIDLKVFSRRDGNAFRKHMGVAEDAFVILFRNSRWSVKNTGMIFDALNKLPSDSKIHIITVGEVMGKLPTHFHFLELGWVNNAELMASVYSAANLFLTPSHESFGMMALESLACSTPVICLKSSAVEELCRSPLAGRSVINNDSDSLANEITLLSKDPVECQKLGSNGRKIAEEYSLPVHVNKLENIYQSLFQNT